jgi:hypothetical protein
VLGCLATKKGHKGALLLRQLSGADAESEALPRTHRQAMHRAVNAYRLLIIEEIGYLHES